MGSARQWLLNMTAGLMPRRLVVNHQQGGLLLKYKIGKKLLPGIIEPLASRAIWCKAMSEIIKVALEDLIWTVSGVDWLEIVSDNSNTYIQVSVALKVKIVDPDRKRNWISVFGKERFSFSDPELRFLFYEEKAPDQTAEDQNDNPAVVMPLKFCRPD